jgi:hypothetical protein
MQTQPPFKAFLFALQDRSFEKASFPRLCIAGAVPHGTINSLMFQGAVSM